MMGEGNWNPEKETLERVVEVEKLLALISEVYGGGDSPQKLKAARAKVQQHMKQFGILNDDSSYNIQNWAQLLVDIADAKNNPIKPENYPDYKQFQETLNKIAEEEDNKQLFHNLQGRMNLPLNKYLHGLGIVMSSKAAYQSIFGETDPITFGKNDSVQNGRHRVAALLVLQAIPYETKSWHWIEHQYE